MTFTQEITEVNLPIPVKLQLSPGKFFVSRHGDTWCCFNLQQINDQVIYNCVRLGDNFVGQFKEDGRHRFQGGDDEVDEDNLLEETNLSVRGICEKPTLTACGEKHNRLLDTMDSLITKSGEALDLIQSQAEDLAESNFRLNYVRILLGKIANDLEPNTLDTTTALIAQDALLWLADRELNERKLGLPL